MQSSYILAINPLSYCTIIIYLVTQKRILQKLQKSKWPIGSITKKNKTQKTHQDIVFCVSYLGTLTRSNLKLFPFKLNRPNYLRKKSCPLLELLTNSIYSRSSGATDDKKVWSETDTALLMHANTELAQLRNLNFCKKEKKIAFEISNSIL